MPATEQTWRDLKLMHLVFGISALLMLVTTIWMLAADHNREYRQVQVQSQRIDDWMAKAAIAQDTTQDFERELSVLEGRLNQAKLQPLSEKLIEQFIEQVSDKADANSIQSAYQDLKNVLQQVQPGKTASGQAVATHTPTLEKGSKAADTRPANQPKSAAATEAENKEAAETLRKVSEARAELFRRMKEAITKVKFIEDDTAAQRKIKRSYYDEVKSQLDIAVRDSLSQRQRDELQQRINVVLEQINSLTRRYEQAVDQRLRLEGLLKQATRGEDLAKKNLEDFQAKVKKLEDMLAERDWPITRSVLEMPILDGFSPRLGIQQIWTPKLTLNNNFRDVARFDRCITCHQQIDKTAPGSASDPAFPPLSRTPILVDLPTPATRPDVAQISEKGDTDKQFNLATQQMYGLRLAATGMLHAADVTIEVVQPLTPAAKAGLQRGDVITEIRVGSKNEKIISRDQALAFLVTDAPWGKPIRLTVRRGLPHPFASHPRLDLFMGSMSPHKMQQVGCTICHQGQGSATAFKWASHTPNSLEQEAEWEKEYGYFHNHHWIFPMYPQRFIESSCLKCHHQVLDLLPSPRFPDPPAPKVVAGYNLVTEMGCFGCHEITGFDGPKPIGPDVRAEPMYFAAGAALQLEVPPQVSALQGLLKTASENQDEAKRRVAELEKELSALKTKLEELKKQEPRPNTEAAEEAISSKQHDLDVARFVATAPAIYRQSVDDLQAIDKLAGILAQHPENTPDRLRLLEYMNVDAARSGAPEKLMSDPALPPELYGLSQTLAAGPDNLAVRGEVIVSLKEIQAAGQPPLRKESFDLIQTLSHPPVLTASAQKLVDQVKTVEGPGTFRKVGPSLRHVAGKLGPGTLNRWIYNPRSIRESTKMPRFFGLHAGLTEDALKTASLYEPIEARAIAQYLIDKSRPLEDLPAPAGVTEAPSAERGKLLFQTRGCLACHQQSETPQGKSTFGPDLTGLGKKLATEKGKDWLVAWLRDPKRYHLRTAMPNLLLEPVAVTGDDGKPLRDARGQTRLTDPPADIAAYLLGSDWASTKDPFTSFVGTEGGAGPDEPALKLAQIDEKLAEFLKKWLPESTDEQRKEFVAKGVPADVVKKLPGEAAKKLGISETDGPPKLDEANKRELARRMALDTLVAEYLLTSFPVSKTREYLDNGIPEEARSTLKGAEVELIGPITTEKKLNYVGRRAISKFGCTGCHDVPGFESARPIGTGLADWGRKETSKLAFEHILEFLPKEQAERAQKAQEKKASKNGSTPHSEKHGSHEHAHLDPHLWGDDGFFVEALMHQQREGFLWQKLRQPRSFDYEKTENKSYNEWLRMPQFNLTEAEREQIMTFVLGLVAEPPAEQYVYQPDARHAAIIRGEKSLATFNCQGCHVLDTAQWKIAFAPGAIEPTSDATLPPFLRYHATPEQKLASQNIDRKGLLSGTLSGLLKVDKAGNPERTRYIIPEGESEGEFLPLADLEGQAISPSAPWGYGAELWQPSVLSGAVVYPKDPLPTLSTELLPKNPKLVKQYDMRGGDFAWLLLPIAITTQKQGDGADAWAWVPPPLIGQGRKTQDKWLHDFLLDPLPIRPGVILRMPKFNMSSDEAESFVQFFAARDNENYPNHYGSPNTTQRLAAEEARYQDKLREAGLRGTRFGDAEKIIISQSGCIKCHLVGDFKPDGSDRALAPNLANVYRRLKPDYTRRWIAKPSLILPYTKMPINFPYDEHKEAEDGFWEQKPEGMKKGVRPYHGDSLEQIDAMTDLLSNWDRFMEAQTSIKKQIQAAGGAAPPAATGNRPQP